MGNHTCVQNKNWSALLTSWLSLSYQRYEVYEDSWEAEGSNKRGVAPAVVYLVRGSLTDWRCRWTRRRTASHASSLSTATYDLRPSPQSSQLVHRPSSFQSSHSSTRLLSLPPAGLVPWGTAPWGTPAPRSASNRRRWQESPVVKRRRCSSWDEPLSLYRWWWTPAWRCSRQPKPLLCPEVSDNNVTCTTQTQLYSCAYLYFWLWFSNHSMQQREGVRSDGRRNMWLSRTVQTNITKTKHFRWWNVLGDMRKPTGGWLFWSWFDINRSTFDKYMRKTNSHFRSQWPWPLIFRTQICSQLP